MRLVAALSAALVASAPLLARAENDKIVLVVTDRSVAQLERLVQEMELAGLGVQRLSPGQERTDARVVVLMPSAAGAPIEIYHQRGGATLLVASVPGDETEDAQALRVAELARALAFEPPAPEAPSSAQPEVVPLPPLRPPPVSPALDAVSLDGRAHAGAPSRRGPARFDFGLSTALGVQSAGASFQIEASATYWPHPLIGVALFGSAPVVGAEITRAVGSATVRSALFAVELATSPTGREMPFAVVLDPGIALDYLHVSGTADGSDAGRDGAKLLGAAYGRAELRAVIAGPLRIKVGALGGAAFPPVDILFQSSVVSTFSPFGSVSVGVVVEP
ncbi:MAG: hypothetical protein JNL21_37005 [Myxococcales bacterium]|nr:hypothetical protein [Myxococcales bacterium]